MSIIDDYKQLQMIENIKNLKEKEMAYKSNLKLCKYQEQQINKLATCIEQIKEIAERDKLVCESCSERYTDGCIGYKDFENDGDCTHCGNGARADLAKQILQKISEVENYNVKGE